MAIASANAHDAPDAALRNSRGDFDTLKTQFKNVQKIRIGPRSYLSFMAKTSKLAAELSPKKGSASNNGANMSDSAITSSLQSLSPFVVKRHRHGLF